MAINTLFFKFFLIILFFLYTKLYIKKLLSQYKDNLEGCIVVSTFSKKPCLKKNNSKFSVYIKFNNYPFSQINVSTYVKTFSYYTKNNTIMTPYFENNDCLDHQYFDIKCFTKIDLVKNNKYNYIWLKFEKKDKTPFVNTIDFYIYDMYNVFDNSKFKNVIFVNGNYALYNFHLNISDNNYPRFISKNKNKTKTDSIYVIMPIKSKL